MKISRRVAISFFSGAVILFVGLLFWPFILNEIIKPAALVAWLLLRMFVLSIDQRFYWIATILVVLVLLYRLVSRGQTTNPPEEFLDSNEIIRTIGYWRSRFLLFNTSIHDDKALKKELFHLLVSHYASRQNTLTNYEIFDAFQRGEIPLPEHIRTIFFPEESQESRQPIKKLLRSIQKTPRTWIRKWTGQEAAEHYRTIDEVLKFMETSQER